jgi:hypothetical protein
MASTIAAAPVRLLSLAFFDTGTADVGTTSKGLAI